MTKIVVTHDMGLTPEEVARLESLGAVKMYDNRPTSGEEWRERVGDADIICCGISGFKDGYQELKDKFISLPYVGHSFLDKEILKQNNLTVANSPGCNKDAVSEWIVAMILILFRDLLFFIGNTSLSRDTGMKKALGLRGKKVLVLGKGNIGTRVGEICEAFGMSTGYFRRGDDLLGKAKGQDVIINCLSANESSQNLLNREFFDSLENTFFISASPRETLDTDALFQALNEGRVLSAAIDDGTMLAGDVNDEYYQKLLQHPKIVATPHSAWSTDVTDRMSNKIMIDNIEAWLKGKPINLI